MFPISRAILQNYSEQYKRDQEQKQIQLAVDAIVQQLLATAAAPPNNERRLQLWFRQHPFSRINPDIYPVIVNALKERFPDTDFLIDPMKTYLLIDWS